MYIQFTIEFYTVTNSRYIKYTPFIFIALVFIGVLLLIFFFFTGFSYNAQLLISKDFKSNTD